MVWLTIDTITLPGLEMKVAHVIIYNWNYTVGGKPFKVTRVLPGPTSWTTLTASYRNLVEHLWKYNIHHYSLGTVLLHWYSHSESKLVQYRPVSAVTRVKCKVLLCWNTPSQITKLKLTNFGISKAEEVFYALVYSKLANCH